MGLFAWLIGGVIAGWLMLPLLI